MIAKMWKFSPRMVNIIRNHHLTRCDMVQKDKDVAVVYLADCICMMMGMGVGADGLAYRFHAEAMEAIGIEAETIPRIMARFASQIQDVEELLKVV
jgi:HD-like signal output (HDOD) protein